MQEVIVIFSLSYFQSTLVLVIFSKHGLSDIHFSDFTKV